MKNRYRWLIEPNIWLGIIITILAAIGLIAGISRHECVGPAENGQIRTEKGVLLYLSLEEIPLVVFHEKSFDSMIFQSALAKIYDWTDHDIFVYGGTREDILLQPIPPNGIVQVYTKSLEFETLAKAYPKYNAKTGSILGGQIFFNLGWDRIAKEVIEVALIHELFHLTGLEDDPPSLELNSIMSSPVTPKNRLTQHDKQLLSKILTSQ